MFEVEVNGRKQKAEVSVRTAILYEAEFGKDIIQDFFGVVDEDDGVIEFETVEDEKTGEKSDRIARIDFTKIDWLATIRVLWAAIKTADPGAKPFGAWSEEVGGLDMMAVRFAVANAMGDCFFCSEAAEA